jgi:hypothetical protein
VVSEEDFSRLEETVHTFRMYTNIVKVNKELPVGSEDESTEKCSSVVGKPA